MLCARIGCRMLLLSPAILGIFLSSDVHRLRIVSKSAIQMVSLLFFLFDTVNIVSSVQIADPLQTSNKKHDVCLSNLSYALGICSWDLNLYDIFYTFHIHRILFLFLLTKGNLLFVILLLLTSLIFAFLLTQGNLLLVTSLIYTFKQKFVSCYMYVSSYFTVTPDEHHIS